MFNREKAIKDLMDKLPDTIFINHDNETLETIVDSINQYLKNNKPLSDFYLMRDIVERNCNVKEEEIGTQIPVPLYLGLVSTMICILISAFDFWMPNVALAMIPSVLGILLTAWSSNKLKTAKLIVESDKHTFLSWLQAKFLPMLSDNIIVGAIRTMTENLTAFNKEFATNTGNIETAFEKVNRFYQLQIQLLNSVKQIADKDLTCQNAELYNVLKNSTAEIATLAQYLQNSNQYLVNVKTLNENLTLQEKHTRAIEEMGAFFKTEFSEIEARKGFISKSVGTVDDYLKRAFEKLKENAELQFNELQKSTVKQQEILQHKAAEMNTIVDEIKGLSKALESMKKLENATNEQNRKLDNLVNAIHALAKTRSESTKAPIPIKPQIPTRETIFLSIFIGLVVGGLAILVLLITN
jgi:uncharacterized protein YoxC